MNTYLPIYYYYENSRPFFNNSYMFQLTYKHRVNKKLSYRFGDNFAVYHKKINNDGAFANDYLYNHHSHLLTFGFERTKFNKSGDFKFFYGIDGITYFSGSFDKTYYYFGTEVYYNEYVYGIGIAPLAGIEFYFNDRFSISTDISVVGGYGWGHIKNNSPVNNPTNGKFSGFAARLYKYAGLTINYSFFKRIE